MTLLKLVSSTLEAFQSTRSFLTRLFRSVMLNIISHVPLFLFFIREDSSFCFIALSTQRYRVNYDVIIFKRNKAIYKRKIDLCMQMF